MFIFFNGLVGFEVNLVYICIEYHLDQLLFLDYIVHNTYNVLVHSYV